MSERKDIHEWPDGTPRTPSERLACVTEKSREANDALERRVRAPLNLRTRALPKKAPPTTEPGICRGCGCTEARACAGGCAWTDASRTLCTKCARQGLR